MIEFINLDKDLCHLERLRAEYQGRAERQLIVKQLRGSGLTFSEIGKQLGISKQAANQIWQRGLKYAP